MNPLPTNRVEANRRPRAGERGGTRNAVLLSVLFLVVVGASAYWFFRSAHRDPAASGSETDVQLSDAARSVLSRLTSPVEIRFYSILDEATVSPALLAYAGQVRRVLSAFEREGKGRINVVAYGSLSNSVAERASADGIKPFNLDKGDACFLGLAVACDTRRETLTDLAPEWERAFEFDLSRAIERVTRPTAQPGPAPDTARLEAEALAQVKRTFTNLEAVTLDQGTRILREQALQEFKAAVNALDARIKEAQQQAGQAQQSGDEPARQAAIKRLQELQAEQAEKVRQVAARLDAQLAAFRQLKSQ